MKIRMKCVHTFGTGRHKRQADITLLFQYMISFDPTLLDLISNFFALCTNTHVFIYNYPQWVELSMIIHEGKG